MGLKRFKNLTRWVEVIAERKAVIKISYYDENWNFFEESYQGIAARIIQQNTTTLKEFFSPIT